MILALFFMHQLDQDIRQAVHGILGQLFPLELELKMQNIWQKKCFLNLIFRILLIFLITRYI